MSHVPNSALSDVPPELCENISAFAPESTYALYAALGKKINIERFFKIPACVSAVRTHTIEYYIHTQPGNVDCARLNCAALIHAYIQTEREDLRALIRKYFMDLGKQRAYALSAEEFFKLRTARVAELLIFFVHIETVASMRFFEYAVDLESIGLIKSHMISVLMRISRISISEGGGVIARYDAKFPVLVPPPNEFAIFRYLVLKKKPDFARAVQANYIKIDKYARRLLECADLELTPEYFRKGAIYLREWDEEAKFMTKFPNILASDACMRTDAVRLALYERHPHIFKLLRATERIHFAVRARNEQILRDCTIEEISRAYPLASEQLSAEDNEFIARAIPHIDWCAE